MGGVPTSGVSSDTEKRGCDGWQAATRDPQGRSFGLVAGHKRVIGRRWAASHDTTHLKKLSLVRQLEENL
jgi:hypothetical protein